MWIDSHCHLDLLTESDAELTALLAAAQTQQVSHLLCVSVSLERYPLMRALVDPHPQVFVSVGVHPDPCEVHEPTEAQLVALAQDPRVIAIGETGLDYLHSSGDMAWQRERFRTHIRAAKIIDKPLIIHSRAAAADTLRILEEERADTVGGVMHCFTEDWATAQQALALGFYISFSGIVTFKTADALREVAAQVPLHRILVETDAPYLAPVPLRGKPNQPAYVRHVGEYLAKLRNLPATEFAQISSANFWRGLGRCATPTSACVA